MSERKEKKASFEYLIPRKGEGEGGARGRGNTRNYLNFSTLKMTENDDLF
jgi:hypothetical protein